MSNQGWDFRSRSVHRSFLLAMSMLALLIPIESAHGASHFSLSPQPRATVTSPPVFLQGGTAGTSVIYTSNTSARVTTAAPSIAFDANRSGNNAGGSASVSWSHTTGSGSNRIMLVGVSIRTTTVSVSSIAYGVQSLTFIRADTHASATIRSELWYLVAPSSGTATVTVTLSGTSKAVGGSSTYTGVNQTSPIDVNDGTTGTSTSPSRSVTVSTANSWLLGHPAISGSGQTVSLEGSGQTMRWDNVTSGGSAASRNRGHGSSKGPVGTGSQTMSWTLSASADWAVSVAAFRPAAASNYNYVLKIVNQVSDLWKTRLKAYSESNIGRLNNCTIYFRNSSDGTSRQIYIESGAYVNQTGPWYDLPASPAERYIVVTLQANNSQVSYVYVYLEILIPNKTTYAQYVITFEIT